MSVVSIGTTNINMGNQGFEGGTAQLSNIFVGTSNNSLDNLWDNKRYPRGSGQSNFGYFYNKKFRCIRVYSNNTSFGTVSITYPVTLSGQGAGLDYGFSYSDYAYVTVTATQTYPYVFQYWQTRTPTSGTVLSYSSSVNLASTDWTGNYTVTAVFA